MFYFILIELFTLLFLLAVARHSFHRAKFFLHIFQQKGYKRKEFLSFIRGTNLSAFVGTAHLFVIPLFLFGLFEQRFTETAFVITIVVFGICFFGPVSYINRHKPKKPLAFTPRLTRLFVVTGAIWMAIAWAGINLGFSFRVILPDITIMALFWMLADMLVPVIVLLASFVMGPVEKRIQQSFIDQAKDKIARMPELRIVAITGSYGKTSTKFMLQTLLKERYSVCFTPGSYNTPMGICKVINNDLEARHQILVLEMGARYTGNIRELCDIARPHVAIITNVGQAHLETFGSVDAIRRTKAELLEGLHKNGTAILNSDDPQVMKMPVRDDVNVVHAGLESGMFSVSDISYSREGCSFRIAPNTSPDEFSLVQTRLLGEHTIRNLVLAFAAGQEFGLRMETMAVAASRIEPVEHRLELKPDGDIVIIDDAFNSNPVGARNAVDVLARFEGGRRIIISPGMVELGSSEDEENRKWGEHIARSSIDLVFLVGKERTRPIAEGLLAQGFPEESVHRFDSFFEARDYLQQNRQKGDVVLLENDLPDVYNEKL